MEVAETPLNVRKDSRSIRIKRVGTDVHLEEAPMNAKVLATLMLILAPGLTLAQSSDHTKSKTMESGREAGQGPGKNGNGSDANGAATPGDSGSDANATTAPSSKPPSKSQ
jgi:hypothetical protein